MHIVTIAVPSRRDARLLSPKCCRWNGNDKKKEKKKRAASSTGPGYCMLFTACLRRSFLAGPRRFHKTVRRRIRYYAPANVESNKSNTLRGFHAVFPLKVSACFCFTAVARSDSVRNVLHWPAAFVVKRARASVDVSFSFITFSACPVDSTWLTTWRRAIYSRRRRIRIRQKKKKKLTGGSNKKNELTLRIRLKKYCKTRRYKKKKKKNFKCRTNNLTKKITDTIRTVD